MNEKTGTGVISEKEKVKKSQSRSVTPLLDTPSGAGLGASHACLLLKVYKTFNTCLLSLLFFKSL